MKQGQRVKYCDFLKGLSIILVILIHIFSTYRGIYFEENKISSNTICKFYFGFREN